MLVIVCKDLVKVTFNSPLLNLIDPIPISKGPIWRRMVLYRIFTIMDLINMHFDSPMAIIY